MPSSGIAYVGFITYLDNQTFDNKRDYLETKLNRGLRVNEELCIRFHHSLADSTRFATGGTGVYFSKDCVHVSTQENLQSYGHVPQLETDTTPMVNDSEWVEFTQTYTSSGGEEYITIGNFKNDDLTPVKDSATPYPWYSGNNNDQGYAYYYIDDISVIPTRPILASNDTIIERGSNVRLSHVTDTISSYQWSPSAGLSDPTSAGPWASPNETTTYTVTKMTHCDTTTAKVKVKVVESLEQPLFIPNIFSPNGTGDPENEEFKVYGDVTFKDYHLMIYNRWGQKVFESTDPNAAWKGEGMEQGVYVYHLSGTLGNGEKVERKGNVTLLN